MFFQSCAMDASGVIGGTWPMRQALRAFALNRDAADVVPQLSVVLTGAGSLRHFIKHASRAALIIALAQGVWVPSALADQIALLDYSKVDFLNGRQFYSEVDRARIASALATVPGDAAKGMGTDFAIMGDASGAFSAPGTTERIYLIQKEAPVAIDPFPKGPAPLLLESAFMNMGEISMAVDVAALNDKGQATVQQTLTDVLLDSCENEGGTKMRKAAIVSVGPDGFTAEPRDIGCGS